MKLRSSHIIIAVLLVLAGLSIYIYKKKGGTRSFEADSRNFKFKDTASITRIFIADKEGDKCTLVRTMSGWVVNNKFNCRSDAILNLMEVIRNVEVKMPVNKGARETVLKVMASQAMKVEIYSGDDLVKQYYVGHETQDAEGSYMLLTDVGSGKNYEEPFVCFIPGFTGYLLPRFIAKEEEWRDRLVINYTPPQIRQIKVEHHEQPDSSFVIEVLNTKTFQLKDSKGTVIPFDEFKMKQYIAYYQNLSYESLLNQRHRKLIDSLARTKPFTTITVSGTNFKVSKYKFFHKFPMITRPEHRVMYKYDPERLYMGFIEGKEWAVGQTFVFGKLLINYDYFLAPSVKK